MSNDTPPFIKSLKNTNNAPLDPIAEFEKLKIETAEISAKIRASAPFLNPDTNTTNEQLGMALMELKMMRKEMKEIKENGNENKKKLEEIGENQKKLQEDVSQLQRDVTGNRQRLDEMKLEQKNQREMLNEIKVNVSSYLKEIKEKQTSLETKMSKLKCQPTIRDLIFGKWKCTSDKDYFSAKFEDDKYMEKWDNENSYIKSTLGVKNQNRWRTVVENNQIVQIKYSKKKNEIRKDVFYFENEKLIHTRSEPGKADQTWTYERIGEPDPE